LPFQTMQKPVMPRSVRRPPTAIPILPPRVKTPVEGVYVPVGTADGEVMFAGVVEKSDPLIETVPPGTGCC